MAAEKKPLSYKGYAQAVQTVIDAGFVVGGTYALSKYGTVYRNYLPDVDVLTDKVEYSQIEDLNLREGLELEGTFDQYLNVIRVPKGINLILDLFPSIKILRRVFHTASMRWNPFTNTFDSEDTRDAF